MANDKEIIKKLIKIADNQQKIINKLAQDVQLGGATGDWLDISSSVSSVLASLPGGRGATVSTAQFAPQSGNAAVKVKIPNMNSTATGELRNALVGKTLTSNDGKSVQLPTDKNKISVIGETV